MNLSNFEAYIDPIILRRGKDYITQVHRLEETEPSFWQAEVRGTYTYDIEIELQNSTISHWSCSCPYDLGSICKHVVATLFNIRNTLSRDSIDNAVFTPRHAQPQAKYITQQERVQILLAQLSKEQLTQYLINLFNDHRDLKEQFLLRFEEHKDTKKVKKDFIASFRRLAKDHTDDYYMDYINTSNFADEAEILLKSLSQAKLNPLAKIDIYINTIEVIGEIAEYTENGNSELEDLLHTIAQALELLSAYLTEESITTLHQQLYELNQNLDFGLGGSFNALLKNLATDRPHLQNYMLDELKKKVTTPNNSHYVQSDAQKLENLLLDWGRETEAQELTETLIAIPNFRERKVKELLEQKNYSEATVLLNEGIQLALANKQYHTTTQWRNYLIAIAKDTNNTELLRTELLNIFQETGYKLQNYLVLKSTYDTAQWDAIKNSIYTSVPTNYTLQRAEILKAENNIPALYELVMQSNNSSIVKSYAQPLSTIYPNEIKQKYADLITASLKNTGRDIYEQAVKDLQELSLLPEGRLLAKQLIGQFNTQYKNRPLMLTLFKTLNANL
ncbi:SWIM zinc finger family protein [Thiofilum flexile]|uniref:SWIM zinc finger family protein n=1 Tax=Thiofilum flexile TaxID=125627 RepID=UPI00035F933D|nr:SWIM zinc finger family protein [Thiofilum flexile]